MPFSMPTYVDGPHTGFETCWAAVRTTTRNGLSKAYCPECNKRVDPFVLVLYITTVPDAPGGVGYVCDGCRTTTNRGQESGPTTKADVLQYLKDQGLSQIPDAYIAWVRANELTRLIVD